jgi:hypothetical protein
MSGGGKNPDYPPDRPRVPEAIELVRQVYALPTGGVGCCLHVLVDDQNIGEAVWTMEYAKEREHEVCYRAAEALSRMSPSQVRRVCDADYYGEDQRAWLAARAERATP